jgi:hypothetical protein
MSEKQARAYMEQAKEKLGAWSMFWSSNNNLETAAELFIKAGNSFQLASMCKYSRLLKKEAYSLHAGNGSYTYIPSSLIGQEAGDAYVEGAKLYKRADHAVFEAARSFEKAAKSYKKVNPKGRLFTNIVMEATLDQSAYTSC